MKLVKLNRRHSAFKEFGHKWAFRFSEYHPKSVGPVEKIMQDMHGSQWRWNKNDSRIWQAKFGHAVRNGPRPYWISFTDEQDITVVLLKVEQANATQ